MATEHDIASQVLENDLKDRTALKILLDRHLSRADRLLVERAEMGGTESFIGSVPLEWFAQKVGFAGQLPLFKEKIDPKTFRVQIDAETINDIQQRPLDWSRQSVLAHYLAVHKVHKFPPILAVMTRSWVDDLKADEWDRNQRATRSVADYVPLDSKGKIGLLELSEEVQIFALDGQHRLMGVQGLLDLIKKGWLQPLNSKGKEVGDPITKEQLYKEYGVTPSEIDTLARERIGIELISAVVRGESREEARRRVKSVFVHVNSRAAPLSKGQIAQLDEDDGFSVVARAAAVFHPLLRKEDDHPERVNWDNSSIVVNSTTLTTLQTLKEMARGLLEPKFSHWVPKGKDYVPMRPSDEQLEEGQQSFAAFLDGLSTIPSFQALETGAETGEYRRFKGEGSGGKGHMLFRPVGQIALAAAIGELLDGQQFPLPDLMRKLREYDEGGGFEMEDPGSLWYMVLYDPNKKRILGRGERLATRLLVYLLGGLGDIVEQQKLRASLAAERTIQIDGKDQAIGFDGQPVDPSEVQLPPVLP